MQTVTGLGNMAAGMQVWCWRNTWDLRSGIQTGDKELCAALHDLLVSLAYYSRQSKPSKEHGMTWKITLSISSNNHKPLVTCLQADVQFLKGILAALKPVAYGE